MPKIWCSPISKKNGPICGPKCLNPIQAGLFWGSEKPGGGAILAPPPNLRKEKYNSNETWHKCYLVQ